MYLKTNKNRISVLSVCMLLLFSIISEAQNFRSLLSKPASWFGSEEAKSIAENVLLYQRNAGGWALHNDYFNDYSDEQRIKISNEKYKRDCSFRDQATFSELEFLAKAFQTVPDKRYLDAFNRGLDFIFEAQYDNGGWPKHYPEPNKVWFVGVQSKWNPEPFERYIAFNDDAQAGILELVKNVAGGKGEFGFVDRERRQKAAEALQKGIECVLKIQFYYDGQLTAWPQQADEVTLEPRWGRHFEPPSIAGRESVGIIRFLMSIENPSPEIIHSVQSAVKWMDDVKILNTKIVESDTMTVLCEVRNKLFPGRRDVWTEHDENAPPVWARYYELNTFRPIFCSRDDTIRHSLAEISLERRSGYRWYGYWPEKLLNEDYPEWCKKHKLENVTE
jgi:PelA/Pel-15E family pectate lyase